MTLQACANLVHAADPVRWKAVMSAPVAAREVMLPIYAANVEISRAPWVTKEPMIALMRLQWWRDALNELASGTPRRHEVVDALATLPGSVVQSLHVTIDARQADVEKEVFADPASLLAYARDTAYGAMAAAHSGLGGNASDAALILDLATAVGTSRVLQAVLDLKGSGWRVFDKSWKSETVAETAEAALVRFAAAKPLLRTKSLANAAFIETAGTERFLHHIRSQPDRVFDGTVAAFSLRTSLDRAMLARRVRTA